jgi:phosphosulfolactate synthase (CoM biosynthesis protein A)
MANAQGFQFLQLNQRQSKPRTRDITEIRGPYYSVMGKPYLRDILETMGTYVDSVKFAGGSFTLMPRPHNRRNYSHSRGAEGTLSIDEIRKMAEY